MKKKNLNIKRCDIKEGLGICGLPIVPIDINGKTRLFLLDSGSQRNAISDEDAIAMACFKPSGKTIKTSGLEGHTCETVLGDLTYEIAGHAFESEFYVLSSKTFASFKEDSGLIVSGILGISFMLTHNCVMDFSKGTVMVTVTTDANSSNQVSKGFHNSS